MSHTEQHLGIRVIDSFTKAATVSAAATAGAAFSFLAGAGLGVAQSLLSGGAQNMAEVGRSAVEVGSFVGKFGMVSGAAIMLGGIGVHFLKRSEHGRYDPVVYFAGLTSVPMLTIVATLAGKNYLENHQRPEAAPVEKPCDTICPIPKDYAEKFRNRGLSLSSRAPQVTVNREP